MLKYQRVYVDEKLMINHRILGCTISGKPNMLLHLFVQTVGLGLNAARMNSDQHASYLSVEVVPIDIEP